MYFLTKKSGFFRRRLKFSRFVSDERAATSLTEFVMGIIFLAILGVGVALPIVVNTVKTVAPNVSGTTAIAIGAIPTIFAAVLLTMFFGRR